MSKETHIETGSAQKGGAYSLRQRYLIITSTLSVFLLGLIWLMHTYVSSQVEQHRENMEQRNLAAHTMLLLRESIMQTEHNLQQFLWTSGENSRNAVIQSIEDALLSFQQLKGLPWLKQSQHAHDLHDLEHTIQALQTNLLEVLDKRNDNHNLRGSSKEIESSGESNSISNLQAVLLQQLEKVGGYLHELEQDIELYDASDAAQLSDITETIIRGIWLLAITGLCLTIISLLYFEQGVLRPITLVAHALKAEAKGQSDYVLPRVNSRESQQLIDAFAEMRFQVQDRQHALENQALCDNLTSLPNRFFWQGALNRQCEEAKREGSSLGVLIVGLDRFKEINDTLGHHIGDRVLQLFGERLKYLLRANDTVARLGSDEFAIMLPDSGQEETVYIARKLIKEMEHPFLIEQINLYVGCSIGVTLYPKTSSNAEELTRHANIAMYAAKRHKSGYALYNSKYDVHSLHKLSLANDLRNAIQDDSLYLVFQPQQSLSSRRCSGMEVLLRWNHSSHGLVRPDEFIPIAEQTGLIHPLTAWVLETSFAQMSAWRKHQLDTGIVSINISVFNLQSTEFIGTLQSLLYKWDIPAEKVMLEITETAMMADPAHAKATLEQLHRLGVKLAIDDFGTGFSSLAYLKQLPVHELKIDKSFVMEMAQDENDAVIVRSTIDLAHNLGLKVVAEGVDSQEVQDLLEILNCDVIQGYHLSKPLLAAEVVKWLPPLLSEGKIRNIKDFR